MRTKQNSQMHKKKDMQRLRELVALLSLSSWCLVIVVWLFFTVPWVYLQFVIVVFSDHTHLLFCMVFCDVLLFLWNFHKGLMYYVRSNFEINKK